MMPYKWLFLHSYNLAINSRENRHDPFYWVFLICTICAILNIGSAIFLIASFERFHFIIYEPYRLVIVLFYLITIFSVYYRNENYSLLIKNKYTQKKFNVKKSIFFVVMYYITSGIILFLSSLVKNKDWIFK